MTNNFNNVSFQNRYLTAEQLNSLSTENLYDYCFIKGNKKDWELDFNKEICDNMDRYPLLSTLAGKPLGYILTKIDMTMSPWIPEGRKLNPKLIYSLQTLIAKNPSQVRDSALTGKANAFISASCTNLTKIINKAFEAEQIINND